MNNLRLHSFFSPANLAVIGRFSCESLEQRIVCRLQQGHYQGKIFTVNIGNGTTGPEQTRALDELPEDTDCVLICLEQALIEDIFSILIGKRVKSILAFPAGSRHRDREWIRLEEKLVALSQESQVFFPGLGGWGVISPAQYFSLFLHSHENVQAGSVAFLGHSGSLALSLAEYARNDGWGFSRLLSGSVRSALESWQVVEFFHSDPQTRVILLHLEWVRNGKYFILACQDAVKEKPIILFKPGTTQGGLKALAAHNGKMPGSEKAWKAAVDQAGIIRTSHLDTMADLAQAFHCISVLPQGNRTAVLGMSDFYVQSTRHMLASFALRASENVLRTEYAEFLADFKRLLEEKEHDVVLLLLELSGLPQDLSLVKEIGVLARESKKSIVACVWSQEDAGRCKALLRGQGIPCYEEISSALLVIQVLGKYARKKEQPYPVQVAYRRDVSKAEQLIAHALERNETFLTGTAAEQLLQAYELVQPNGQLARTSQHAVKAAKKIGFPVTLKVVSPQLTQSGDWAISSFLHDAEEVRAIFQELTNRVLRLHRDIHVAGCMVCEAVPGAFSVIIRSRRDDQFGPLISLSGWSEYQNKEKDIVSCLAPLGLTETKMMVQELFSALRIKKEKFGIGMRALEDVVLSVARMALDCPQIYQAQLQPVLVTTQSVLVVDASFTLSARKH